MSIDRQTEVFYGVLVGKHDNDPQRQEPHSYTLDQELRDRFGEDNESVADGVMRWMCGDYDRNNLYLVIHHDSYASKIMEDGEARFISPTMQPFVENGWNSLLRAACEALELVPLSGFGWFVVADVS